MLPNLIMCTVVVHGTSEARTEIQNHVNIRHSGPTLPYPQVKVCEGSVSKGEALHGKKLISHG